MLHILICEDDNRQRAHIENIVNKYISAQDVEMELALSTGNPAGVLDYLQTHPDKRSLYFLDIDLQHDKIDGMGLAVIIKDTDPYAKIVFITTHSEQAHLTFEHKIGAIDFIVKGLPEAIERRTVECLTLAYERYLDEKSALMKFLNIDANGEVWSVPYDDILFIETHTKVRNKLILHTETGEIEFRGVLSDIEMQVPEFYRCHKSYLLNVGKVIYIDKRTKEAVMPGDKRVLVAEKKMAEFVGVVGER